MNVGGGREGERGSRGRKGRTDAPGRGQSLQDSRATKTRCRLREHQASVLGSQTAVGGKVKTRAVPGPEGAPAEARELPNSVPEGSPYVF